MDGVLSGVNGRTFASLVAENEPTAAIAGLSLGVVGAVVVRRFPMSTPRPAHDRVAGPYRISVPPGTSRQLPVTPSLEG